jgi:hypothetical protein
VPADLEVVGAPALAMAEAEEAVVAVVVVAAAVVAGVVVAAEAEVVASG